jgi:fructokinase
MLLAGIETGGTSIKVAIAKDHPSNIIDKKSFETSKDDPSKSVAKVVAWLRERKFDALGIASFGPIDLNKSSSTYGYITSTPKLAWQNFNLLKPFRDAFQVNGFPEIGFDTDVNAPALSEYEFGNHPNCSSVAYVTAGTGIGVGLFINGKPVHGLLHPECGHILIPIHPKDEKFEGVCPFHGNCLEGMCTSVSLAKRKGIDISQLPSLDDNDEIWDIAAFYYSCLCVNLLLMTSIEVIVVGGGIFERKCLLPKVRSLVAKKLNGYLVHDKIQKMDQLIVDSTFKSDSGIVGALGLAYHSLKNKSL